MILRKKPMLFEKWMTGRYSSLQIKTTQYFKQWTTGSGVLKKIYCLYKNLMLQIDPLNSKTTVPQKGN